MKHVSLALTLTLTILTLSFGLSPGLDITAEISGPGVWLSNDTTFIQPRLEFNLDIYADNNSIVRLGWSSPFQLTGTGDIRHIIPLAVVDSFATSAFNAIWDVGAFTATESWDGDLTVPDMWNFSGISIAGWDPGDGPLLAMRVPLKIDETDLATGAFCIDSADFPGTTYDWLFESPSPDFLKTCWPIRANPGGIPEITNCPDTIYGQWSEPVEYAIEAWDSDDDPIAFSVVSGPGTIDPQTGEWTFIPSCDDIGQHQVSLCAGDPIHPCPTGQECLFTIEILNTAPVISGDCDDTVTVIATGSGLARFTAEDINTGDTRNWSVIGPSPEPAGSWNIADGLLSFTPGENDEGLFFDFNVRATDCAGDYDECSVTFYVASSRPFDFTIQKVHDAYPGHHNLVAVSKTAGSEEIWGFDFLIGYETGALNFTGASPADMFDIPGTYEWEYFTYRHNWNDNCGQDCPTGLLRAVGLADQNDGAHRPLDVTLADSLPLFYIDFLVTSNPNFGCLFAPVYFYWQDCGDNTVAFRYLADIPELIIRTGLASDVYQYCFDSDTSQPHYCEITDPLYGFPGPFGPDTACFDCPDPENPQKCPVPFVRLFGGGVDIICADEIDERGDVNLNGIPNEIADAVVFTNYFINGLAAFLVNVDGQIVATDINADGTVLTLADLVYLIRIVIGETTPIDKNSPPLRATLTTGTTVAIDTDIRAALFVFEGEVELSLAEGARKMDLKYDYIDGKTRALLYSFEKGVTAAGELIRTDGRLLSVNAADYDGRSIETSVIPATLSLHSYPNPFNRSTVIEMSLPSPADWNLLIYNALGRRVAQYNGHTEAPGKHVIHFDAAGLASGIYFCKLITGDRTLTEKMILAK